MASQALRDKQAPIKASYKTDPDSAIITLNASGSLDASTITCKLDTGKQAAAAEAKIAGLHQKSGGEGYEISGELCSGDMLLEALVACAGVTLKAVATAMDIPIKSGTVRAEGDLDFKGTMGVDRDAPVGFKDIRLSFDLKFQDGELVPDEKVEKLGKLTERYCVVLQTISKKPNMSVSLHGSQKDPEDASIERATAWGHKG
ncbi:unnamed protein product [Zymoseptoria tritici ST99CH_1A5]|uniref:OsmC-like protein n=4 Tax=Zymoseptoria tritici TaxID=1047171 RepID=F9XCL4_ZYMTI|nr:uncharacterized protein MYCGRDRAFT_109530 [Zymoseptoria tritici IPO323]SMQ50911.1 unnamed protein product [Zymoseptoria tritici ST99CH_3D7]SMR52830.1 unnamed protein product [Zymoseptoria tritici ST99CH_1E4]SMR54193.1 unnamed protein product [Zymoseptoria tritici ST99CH_3D1]SMY24573.1 unnamed protein product [Zymoseptoria tritici ST99CH_1A5]EGP87571.1 hypothetical protein MYCGRDRAFT_109530 [Zymoseptoria tritici IPO323]